MITAGEETVRDYQRSHRGEVVAGQGEFQDALEGHMGQMLLGYAETHLRIKHRDSIVELGQILSGTSRLTSQLTPQRLDERKTLLCSRITDVMLGDYVPFFKYEEQANLIIMYCSYVELTHSKRVRGGREGGISDMKKFYRKMLLREFPMKRMRHAKEWLLVDHLIENDVPLR